MLTLSALLSLVVGSAGLPVLDREIAENGSPQKDDSRFWLKDGGKHCLGNRQ